ncbi:hypothetical protein DSM104635_00775 [Terricaulis silvestris]|uniref:C2H2-type domain-containing protein n=1 Tax=Terricaulis silvestris TaxID=2686094 RepID=A0A6I6MGW4_9CAUL|nr:hypothetical protein DSM104635_00775 [Terricaulis silvestris]
MERERSSPRQERLRQIAAILSRAYDAGSEDSVESLCQGIHPDSAEEHIVICPVCGQMFDCRDQLQVAHHSTAEHAPKLFS